MVVALTQIFICVRICFKFFMSCNHRCSSNANIAGEVDSGNNTVEYVAATFWAAGSKITKPSSVIHTGSAQQPHIFEKRRETVSTTYVKPNYFVAAQVTNCSQNHF